MVPGARGIGRLDRLDVRLVLLLGFALLPIGLIAVVQTYRMITLAEEQFESALIGETLSAAATEHEILQRELGASRALVPAVEALLDTPEACSKLLSSVAETNNDVIFAGVVDMSGHVSCGSNGIGRDLSKSPAVTDFLNDMSEDIAVNAQGAVTDTSVVVIRQPLQRDGEPAGYLALSVPHTALSFNGTAIASAVPDDILTVNAAGNVLTSAAGLDTVKDRLPADRDLGALVQGQERLVVEAENERGDERIYTIVPLMGGVAHVIGIWRPNSFWPLAATAASATLFPLLMWLASLAVAYFAVHRLVVRHIRGLRLRIRAFSMTRKLIPEIDDPSMPAELREVYAAFQSMTERIVRDEADQENSLHEKDVLLKEVHHRVKNNLQLIASITNMQIRKSPNSETRFILKRLQDRVMGLATIHRNLYATTAISAIEVDVLLQDLTTQLATASSAAEAGIDLDSRFDKVSLYPDQAVPLALLLTEALTNALKYVGRPDQGPPWIRVTLDVSESEEITLSVANSAGDPVNEPEQGTVSGLGSQLIAAFTMQLGATDTSPERDGRHEVRVTFQPSEFADEA